MKIPIMGMLISLLPLLIACGADRESSNPNQEPEQVPQGILSKPQQQALDAARSVEQTLLNSAADREKELEARLRAQ